MSRSRFNMSVIKLDSTGQPNIINFIPILQSNDKDKDHYGSFSIFSTSEEEFIGFMYRELEDDNKHRPTFTNSNSTSSAFSILYVDENGYYGQDSIFFFNQAEVHVPARKVYQLSDKEYLVFGIGNGFQKVGKVSLQK